MDHIVWTIWFGKRKAISNTLKCWVTSEFCWRWNLIPDRDEFLSWGCSCWQFFMFDRKYSSTAFYHIHQHHCCNHKRFKNCFRRRYMCVFILRSVLERLRTTQNWSFWAKCLAKWFLTLLLGKFMVELLNFTRS